MELTYTEVDGYFYPDLTLPETEDHRPLGKYGLLRKTYLKRYRPMMYDRLLLAGKLDVHLRKIDALAAEQVDRVIADLAAKEGVDEQLKATDQLRWVGQMNSFKAAAEEQVLREIVYGYLAAQKAARRAPGDTPGPHFAASDSNTAGPGRPRRVRPFAAVFAALYCDWRKTRRKTVIFLEKLPTINCDENNRLSQPLRTL